MQRPSCPAATVVGGNHCGESPQRPFELRAIGGASQATDRADVVRTRVGYHVAPAGEERCEHRCRHPNREVRLVDVRAIEERRRHADHRESVRIDRDGLPDDRRVAAEPGAPGVVAQDRHRMRPLAEIFVGSEAAPHQHRGAKHGEVISRDRFPLNAHRVAGGPQGERKSTRGRQPVEEGHLLPDSLGDRVGDPRRARALAPRRRDPDQRRRLADPRARTPQDGVGQRVERRVRADPEGQRRHRQQREAGAPQHLADGIAEVGEELIHEVDGRGSRERKGQEAYRLAGTRLTTVAVATWSEVRPLSDRTQAFGGGTWCPDPDGCHVAPSRARDSCGDNART